MPSELQYAEMGTQELRRAFNKLVTTTTLSKSDPSPVNWQNVGEAISGMRNRGFAYMAENVDGPHNVLFLKNASPDSVRGEGVSRNPERAVLIAVLCALDAEAAQAVQGERESESEAHDAD